MSRQRIILRDALRRRMACELIAAAPEGSTVTIQEPGRTLDQNARMWAMLGDVSRAQPEGRRYTADEWKAVFMHAAGWEVQFLTGLDGRPFPHGFRSSRMSKRQMADLITYIMAYGDQHGVEWTEPHPDERSAA